MTAETIDLTVIEESASSSKCHRYKREINLIICIVGIYSSYLAYGYVQESLYASFVYIADMLVHPHCLMANVSSTVCS